MNVFFLFVILLHGQPHSVFGGFVSIFERWMLLCTELMLAENNPHLTMQSITTFDCALGVLAGVSVL